MLVFHAGHVLRDVWRCAVRWAWRVAWFSALCVVVWCVQDVDCDEGAGVLCDMWCSIWCVCGGVPNACMINIHSIESTDYNTTRTLRTRKRTQTHSFNTAGLLHFRGIFHLVSHLSISLRLTHYGKLPGDL